MEYTDSKNELKTKIHKGDRITSEEARELFAWDILDLGAAADARRRSSVPTEEVGFIADRIINFTNVCEAACLFCAFHTRARTLYYN